MRKPSLVFFVALCLGSVRASAQPTTTPTEEKESRLLFDDARRLIERGDCATALPKLIASLKVNPSVGASLSVGECVEASDPLSAWRADKDAQRLGMKRNDPRAEHARTKAAALEPRLAMVQIQIHVRRSRDQETGIDTQRDVEARVDGARLDRFFHDTPMAIEPGRHVIEVKIEGRPAVATREFEATVGTVLPIDVDLMDGADDLLQGNAVMRSPGAAEGLRALPDGGEKDPPRSTTQHRISVVTAGAGALAIGASAAFGLFVLAEKNDLQERCAAGGGSFPDRCGGGTLSLEAQADLQSRTSTMNTWTTVATAAFITGGIALVAGIVLYVTAPKKVHGGVAKARAFTMEATW